MTTFISYSRVNSDFAVRLARDLKKGNCDVWLDQLDIPTGSRWDDEIEKALEECEIFLIILSPESIKSQNVKDEIGYAIDTGKQILPVVLENCKVPFRLRRFQYVDCTDQPYKDSLDKIKYLLSNIKGSKSSEQVGVVRTEQIREKLKPEQILRKKKRNPQIIGGFIGLAVLILAAVFGLPSLLNHPENTPKLIMKTNGTEITDDFGVEMVHVPEGYFIMGSDSGDESDYKHEHEVHVLSFYIDKYEVTNERYKACVDIGVCQHPIEIKSSKINFYYGNTSFDNYPVIYVNWYMAKTYCEWRGARLPTEAEWEKAARGTDGRLYPWGNESVDTSYANFYLSDTAPVGSYEKGKSIYGVYDMSGNVWEWVSTLKMPYPYAFNDGREDQRAAGNRVLRGGGWTAIWPIFIRGELDPEESGHVFGFRCARSFK